jgi:hypothetical protein
MGTIDLLVLLICLSRVFFISNWAIFQKVVIFKFILQNNADISVDSELL